MRINHIKLTDEIQYQNLKKYNKENSEFFMDADEWKELRLKRLSEEGKVWSK